MKRNSKQSQRVQNTREETYGAARDGAAETDAEGSGEGAASPKPREAARAAEGGAADTGGATCGAAGGTNTDAAGGRERTCAREATASLQALSREVSAAHAPATVEAAAMAGGTLYVSIQTGPSRTSRALSAVAEASPAAVVAGNASSSKLIRVRSCGLKNNGNESDIQTTTHRTTVRKRTVGSSIRMHTQTISKQREREREKRETGRANPKREIMKFCRMPSPNAESVLQQQYSEGFAQRKHRPKVPVSQQMHAHNMGDWMRHRHPQTLRGLTRDRQPHFQRPRGIWG